MTAFPVAIATLRRYTHANKLLDAFLSVIVFFYVRQTSQLLQQMKCSSDERVQSCSIKVRPQFSWRPWSRRSSCVTLGLFFWVQPAPQDTTEDTEKDVCSERFYSYVEEFTLLLDV